MIEGGSACGCTFEMPDFPPIESHWLGLQPYEAAARLQRAWVLEIADGLRPDSLLLLEHPPVITLGRRRGAERNVLDAGGVPVVEVERGGDATFHAPGQLVGYPLIRLLGEERDLHRYLRNLEHVLIRTLLVLGFEAHTRPGLTGVWVGEQKLASVGVAVRKWTTYHGFALNVHNNSAEFARLNPCGLPATSMASLCELMPEPPPPLHTVANILLNQFSEVFQRSVTSVTPHAVALRDLSPCR